MSNLQKALEWLAQGKDISWTLIAPEQDSEYYLSVDCFSLGAYHKETGILSSEFHKIFFEAIANEWCDFYVYESTESKIRKWQAEIDKYQLMIEMAEREDKDE